MKRILMRALVASLFSTVVVGQQVKEMTVRTSAVSRSSAVTEAERKSLIAVLEALKAEDIPELVRKAEAGDVKAQWMLGITHAEGKVVAKDYAKSWFWIQRSAETDWAIGQSAVGIAYMAGLGVER